MNIGNGYYFEISAAGLFIIGTQGKQQSHKLYIGL